MSRHEEVSCGLAEDFLDQISLRGPHTKDEGRYAWMYRGQSEPWPLLPSAWRPEQLADFEAEEARETYEGLVRLEFHAARRFFTLADRRGLALPEDTRAIRQDIEAAKPPSLSQWPLGTPWLSTLALAQHHGLPTRLLDWSWNPYVAAYFAASGLAVHHHHDVVGPPIEVWALNSAACDLPTQRELGIQYSRGKLRQVTAPAAGNANLRAQEGAFTHWSPTEQDWQQPIAVAPLEVEIGEATTTAPDLVLLRRFTLPREEVPLLLRLLESEGVSGSSVWPGYRGVADEVRGWLMKPESLY